MVNVGQTLRKLKECTLCIDLLQANVLAASLNRRKDVTRQINEHFNKIDRDIKNALEFQKRNLQQQIESQKSLYEESMSVIDSQLSHITSSEFKFPVGKQSVVRELAKFKPVPNLNLTKVVVAEINSSFQMDTQKLPLFRITSTKVRKGKLLMRSCLVLIF